MKSQHLAKADFLRQLARQAEALYALGDFTSTDPKRVRLSAKMAGFIDAGTTLEVVTSTDVEQVIDKAHRDVLGDGRQERRARILEARAKHADAPIDLASVDWEVYDSPARDRQG